MSTPRHTLPAQFAKSERGSVAMIFGLMMTAIVLFGGLAVDYGRVVDLRGRMIDAVDSATLAAGRAMLDGELSDTEIAERARTFVIQNLGPVGNDITLSDPDVSLDRNTGAVAISIAADLAMTLAKIAGVENVRVPVTSEANFRQKDIEVGMALDITGSMDGRIDDTSKIESLKGAFETFANRLLPDNRATSQRVRIALAPYSASVNVGADANYITNNASRDGCVTEARGGQYSDERDTYLTSRNNARDTDPTDRRQGYVCPSNRITPLTDDREALINEVRSFEPSGGTAGHIGTQWAWNLISDQWTSVFNGQSAPDSYARVEDEELLKAVIVMSDGIFNTAYNGPHSSEQAVRLCDAMKAKGVRVFTIAFGLEPGSTAEQTLQSCATEGEDYFVAAATSEQLDAAFEKFADKLSQLRLVR